MNSRLFRNSCISIAAILIAVYFAVPPKEKLRLGKDLAGGVSLMYSAQIGPNEDAAATIGQMITVLKERVDPGGLLEINMVRQGRDRIEVTMPLPGPEIKAARKAIDDRLKAIGELSVSASTLDAMMASDPAARAKRIASFTEAAVRTRIEAAAKAYDAAATARAEFEKAKADKADEATVNRLAGVTAERELAYDQARHAAVTAIPGANELSHALTLSKQERKLDAGNGTFETLPSPRQRALDRLREQHPDSKAIIDSFVADYEAYESKRRTLDDPQDLIRLLRGSGVLSFRITVDATGAYSHPDEVRLRSELRERGPRNVRSSDVHWYKINQIENWFNRVDQMRFLRDNPVEFWRQRGFVGEEYNGEYYILAWDTPRLRLTAAEGQWKVRAAFEGRDERGLPCISFAMDDRGALLLGELTRDPSKTNQKMAVILDDEVYTAPSLRSAISASGQITGDFSVAERNYIIRTLAAGSLQAKLSPEPISVRQLAPELGMDNLKKGLYSGVVAIIVIGVFMWVYYFGLGLLSIIALIANAVLIVGAMAAQKAAFSMPGIAGIILTFGVAIDSNVLIYERMREELNRGNDLKTAVRLGFSRAMSSIVDANITNLLVCIVLAQFGTEEIKGFAITMGVGVISTLFSVIVSRALIDFYVIKLKVTKVRMLPMVWPGLQRALTPNIDWIGYRRYFFVVSAIFVVVSLALVAIKGGELLDIEFRGGTQVQIQLKPDVATGRPMTMKRAEIEDRVHAVGEKAPAESDLRELQTAEVVAINPQADGVSSDRFIIKTLATQNDEVQHAVQEALADVLDVKLPRSFAGSDISAEDVRRPEGMANAPIFRVVARRLGDAIERPKFTQDASKFVGGVAIRLDEINPPISLDELRGRLDATRSSGDYSATLTRLREVFVLEGTDDAVTGAALLVRDENLSLFENEARWEDQVARVEWALVVDALTKRQDLASVDSISPAVAQSFRRDGIIATLVSFLMIGIYIWVRFKSFRYSVAAIIALLLDCFTVIGFIALANFLWDWSATRAAAGYLLILPFKIDLNLVAALLTVAGYSLNDAIIIMDRIRENRGKGLVASKSMVNAAINQTISRTFITAGTTLFSSVVLYLFGGEGMRGFAYLLTIGVALATFYSIGVAAPIVWSKKDADDGVEEARAG